MKRSKFEKRYSLLGATLLVITVVAAWGTLIWNAKPEETPELKTHVPLVRYHGYKLNPASIAKAKQFTVLVSVEGFAGHSRGTGVLLDSHHVLTCSHVARHRNGELWVYFYPSNAYSVAKVVYDDFENDLAVLELTDGAVDLQVKPTFQEKYTIGEPITIIGNILGSMKWFVGYGIIGGTTGHFLLTDGLVLGGDSGGPWINEKGEIVAISDFGYEEEGRPIGINGGVSAKTVNETLKKWRLFEALDNLQGETTTVSRKI